MTIIDPRIEAAFDASHDFSLADSLVMLCYVGSTSHNTFVPKDNPDSIDDVDLLGVVVPPLGYTLGLQAFDHWTFQQDELDVVVYSLAKFLRLLVKSNPNVLGTLWLKDEHYRLRTSVWDRLQEERALFATKAAHGAFAGYANAQLQKMTAFRFEGYMGEKRKSLVTRFGYDCKNAAHLIRLLRMCIEFLADGQMRVWRTDDADDIRAIKSGHWPLERVQLEAEQLFMRAKDARDRSPLPYEPDVAAVSRLSVELHLNAYDLIGSGFSL